MTLIFAESVNDHGKIFTLLKRVWLNPTISTPSLLKALSLIIRFLHWEADTANILLVGRSYAAC